MKYYIKLECKEKREHITQEVKAKDYYYIDEYLKKLLRFENDI